MPRSIHRTSSSHFRFTVLLAVIFLAGSGNWRDGMAQQRSPQQRVGDGEKTVLLYGQQKERETTEVRAVITVRGKLTEREEVKAGPVPMEAVAQVVYDEHILPIGSEHTSAEPLTSARFYRQAQAQLKVGDHGQTTKLAAGAELQLATYGADGLRIFSPTRPLTRDELELLELPGSSLLIGQLLPNQQTSIGQ
ncbi:MAG: hypothetical protein KDA60_20345, partial [Planctomycetales bacterium]|nr:hypothetical protein [Planctomycetales bacterium]